MTMDFTQFNLDLEELTRYVDMFSEIRDAARRLYNSRFIDIQIDYVTTEAAGNSVTVYKLPEGYQVLLVTGRALYTKAHNAEVIVTHNISPLVT
jgi:hypothetical protein